MNTTFSEGAKTLVIATLTAICVFLLFFNNCSKHNLQTENNLLNNSLDTLHKTKNKDGTETSNISLLQGSLKQLEQLKTLDNSIKSLQEEVLKVKSLIGKSGSVTVYSNTTIYNNTSQTSISGDSLYPTYISNNKDTTWIKWKTIANKDSTNLSLFVKNAYTVVLGQERYGFLKLKTRPIVEVTNKNPYTSTTSLRAFQVTEKSHRFGIGVQLGYGFSPYKISPYIGIGINYNLITF